MMSLASKLRFVYDTTTWTPDGRPPLAPTRRHVAMNMTFGWGVFDRFEHRFLQNTEVDAMPPHALIQEMPLLVQ